MNEETANPAIIRAFAMFADMAQKVLDAAEENRQVLESISVELKAEVETLRTEVAELRDEVASLNEAREST